MRDRNPAASCLALYRALGTLRGTLRGVGTLGTLGKGRRQTDLTNELLDAALDAYDLLFSHILRLDLSSLSRPFFSPGKNAINVKI